MKPTMCSFEAAVVAAARSDAWTPALRDHVAGCASCHETLDVVQAMTTLATQTVAPTAPPYHVAWLRAEYARRQQREARRDPVLAFVPAALAVALVAALFLWSGAPPHNLVRESIALAARSSLFTGGVGLAVLLGFVMLAFVVMEESSRSKR